MEWIQEGGMDEMEGRNRNGRMEWTWIWGQMEEWQPRSCIGCHLDTAAPSGDVRTRRDDDPAAFPEHPACLRAPAAGCRLPVVAGIRIMTPPSWLGSLVLLAAAISGLPRSRPSWRNRAPPDVAGTVPYNTAGPVRRRRCVRSPTQRWLRQLRAAYCGHGTPVVGGRSVARAQRGGLPPSRLVGARRFAGAPGRSPIDLIAESSGRRAVANDRVALALPAVLAAVLARRGRTIAAGVAGSLLGCPRRGGATRAAAAAGCRRLACSWCSSGGVSRPRRCPRRRGDRDARWGLTRGRPQSAHTRRV